jgi:diadenosine tetraphosphatase ApaH/serine/threonine PP2A family protein phosphatase
LKNKELVMVDRPTSTFQRLAHTSKADVVVFGHTHLPYTKSVDGVLFVNVGSVGKPKDGDPRACYAIIDLIGVPPVMFRRVEYNITTVADAIRHSELPDTCARDLELGGTPRPASQHA